jgi:hypothetical protein
MIDLSFSKDLMCCLTENASQQRILSVFDLRGMSTVTQRDVTELGVNMCCVSLCQKRVFVASRAQVWTLSLSMELLQACSLMFSLPSSSFCNSYMIVSVGLFLCGWGIEGISGISGRNTRFRWSSAACLGQ